MLMHAGGPPSTRVLAMCPAVGALFLKKKGNAYPFSQKKRNAYSLRTQIHNTKVNGCCWTYQLKVYKI